MTTTDIFTHYRAHSDLYTRDIHPGIPLPASITPAVWIPIVDPHKFVSLHLTRLAEGAPILQKLAVKNLVALHRSLTTTAHT